MYLFLIRSLSAKTFFGVFIDFPIFFFVVIDIHRRWVLMSNGLIRNSLPSEGFVNCKCYFVSTA